MMNKGESTDHQVNGKSQINQEDLKYFCGRTEEIKFLEDIIFNQSASVKVISLYGIAGIGKTFLLQKIASTLEERKELFFNIDCRKLKRYPQYFSKSLLEVVKDSLDTNSNQNITQGDISHKPAVIVFDHYDEDSHVEGWLIEELMQYIPDKMSIILSGRKPLQGEWMASPTCKSITRCLELGYLDFNSVKEYIRKRGITENSDVYKLWNFTKGHPLALSLFISRLIEKGNKSFKLEEQYDLIYELVYTFLREVLHDREIRTLIETASILHHFTEESLSFIRGEEVTSITFDRLTMISFIKPGKNGWHIDYFVRKMLNQYFRHSNFKRVEDISKKCAAFYRQKLFANSARENLLFYISEFIFHQSDKLIAASLFDQYAESSYYLEPVNEENIVQVDDYFEQRKIQYSDYEVEYYDQNTSEKFPFFVTMAHNKKENELLDLESLKKIGYNCFTLLKDNNHHTAGISIIIPINNITVPFLREYPTSRSYFNQLSKKELNEYMVKQPDQAGLFIRMIDVANPEDPGRRSYLMFSLLPLLLSGGRIVTSTPLKMYQQLLESFGFERIEAATHFDYGTNSPSNTYLLDVRGPRLIAYLDKLASNIDEQPTLKISKKTFPFSPREIEVAELLMEGNTNDEIAFKLSISQITVKKHVSNLLKKAGVKNRAQLIRRLLDSVQE